MKCNPDILVALLCLAMVPPFPVAKKRYARVEAPTKGSGALALITPNLVVPPKLKTNNITITFTLTNNMVQVFPGIYVAYVSNLHRLATNYAELYGRTNLSQSWVFLSRTNRSPFRHSTTNRAMFYRLNSLWL